MRISRDQMFMEMAEAAAKRSTCFRNAVGAILVRDNNVVAIGYNGPPSGESHCTGHTCPGATLKCERSVHAEINALNRRSGPADTLYVTLSPCFHCAETLSKLHMLERIVYRHEYRDTNPLTFLATTLIKLHRLTASGYLVDFRTGQLIHA